MATTTPAPTIDWTDVQGVVLRGYGKHPYAANLFLQVDDAAQARTWLGATCDGIMTAERATARGDECYSNLAFTRTGLAKLGLSEAVLANFPTAFFEGMASDNRARILGDDGLSASKNWAWGGPGTEVDAILLIFAKEPAALDLAVKAAQAAMTGVSLKYRAGELSVVGRSEGAFRISRRRVAAHDQREPAAEASKREPLGRCALRRCERHQGWRISSGLSQRI